MAKYFNFYFSVVALERFGFLSNFTRNCCSIKIENIARNQQEERQRSFRRVAFEKKNNLFSNSSLWDSKHFNSQMKAKEDMKKALTAINVHSQLISLAIHQQNKTKPSQKRIKINKIIDS